MGEAEGGTGGSLGKNIHKAKFFCVILQSHALNLRFDMSVIYKRQVNVAGEPLRSTRAGSLVTLLLPEQRGWQRPGTDQMQSVMGKGALSSHTLGSSLN